MSYDKGTLRKALGLSESANDDSIILKLYERQTKMTSAAPTSSAPATAAMSPAVLAEQQEILGLFTKLTEMNPNGLSLDEKDAMEQTFAQHPELYDAYRQSALQSG